MALEDYLPGALVGSCGSNEPVRLATTGLTYLNLPAGMNTGFLALSGSSTRYEVIPYPGPAGGRIELCDQCTANANCTPLPINQGTTISLSGGAALKFEHVVSIDPVRLRFAPLPE